MKSLKAQLIQIGASKHNRQAIKVLYIEVTIKIDGC